MTNAMLVFDRATVRRRRDRSTAGLPDSDFLIRDIAANLVDRLDDVKRAFPRALSIGGYGDLASELLQSGRGGVRTLVQCDLSERRMRAASGLRVVADEEFSPFAEGAFDVVVAVLTLHWVNDLPGALAQIRRALKPDGLLLAAMFGGETLKELRRAFAEAEIELEGGLSPRISPFADVRDAGQLLLRAGFALPVVDAETITVSYSDPLRLLRDLRGMGEANAVCERRKSLTRRATLEAALERYRALYADGEGRVPASFQALYLTGWAPDPSQPRALKPGSAAARLAEALGACEIPAGEATPFAAAADRDEGDGGKR